MTRRFFAVAALAVAMVMSLLSPASAATPTVPDDLGGCPAEETTVEQVESRRNSRLTAELRTVRTIIDIALDGDTLTVHYQIVATLNDPWAIDPVTRRRGVVEVTVVPATCSVQLDDDDDDGGGDPGDGGGSDREELWLRYLCFRLQERFDRRGLVYDMRCNDLP